MSTSRSNDGTAHGTETWPRQDACGTSGISQPAADGVGMAVANVASVSRPASAHPAVAPWGPAPMGGDVPSAAAARLRLTSNEASSTIAAAGFRALLASTNSSPSAAGLLSSAFGQRPSSMLMQDSTSGTQGASLIPDVLASPRSESNHAPSQDGSQTQEHASQDSFSSYIHKNAGIVASSSSQSSRDARSRSSSVTPAGSANKRTGDGAHDSTGAASPEFDGKYQHRDAGHGSWPSPHGSKRSAALARHFAAGSQPSLDSASSQSASSPPQVFASASLDDHHVSTEGSNLSILADTSTMPGGTSLSFATSTASERLTDTSFSFSNISHPPTAYAGDDSMTTIGSTSGNSTSLLGKPNSSLLDSNAQSGFARQTSFRTFMGESWPAILNAQTQVAASALAPSIPAYARTIIGRKRNRAALESQNKADADVANSQAAGAVQQAASANRTISETDAAAELRSKLIAKRGRIGDSTGRQRGRKSRNTKPGGQASRHSSGSKGYRAISLHTSATGRALLGMRTRPYETVAANVALIRAPWMPLPLPSPPLEQASRLTPATSTSGLIKSIPLELLAELRATAGVLPPPQKSEGDFAYKSVHAWASGDYASLASPGSEEHPSSITQPKEIRAPQQPPPDSCEKGTASAESPAPCETIAAGLESDTTSAADMAGAPFGHLKPPTPSKAQHVFSATRFGNVLGPHANVAPLRCASAPAGFSLHISKKASAFTTLRVILEPASGKQPRRPNDVHTQAGLTRAKRAYVAKGFCRTPSLDAVMQRGEVADRDTSHAPAPTPPLATRRFNAVRGPGASTPLLSTLRHSHPSADEPDELLSDSEAEEGAPFAQLPSLSSVNFDYTSDLNGLEPGDYRQEDDDEDEEDDAARFALSSDHYDFDAVTNETSVPTRVKRRFGVARLDNQNEASSASAGTPFLMDVDGFRRPGAPLGAGISGTAQRRSLAGHVRDGEEGHERAFSRANSAGQMEPHARSWDDASHPAFGARGSEQRPQGQYPVRYSSTATRPTFSAERHNASPVSKQNNFLAMSSDWARQHGHNGHSGSTSAVLTPGTSWRGAVGTLGSTARSSISQSRYPPEVMQSSSAPSDDFSDANRAGHNVTFGRSATMPSRLGQAYPQRQSDGYGQRHTVSGVARGALMGSHIHGTDASQAHRGFVAAEGISRSFASSNPNTTNSKKRARSAQFDEDSESAPMSGRRLSKPRVGHLQSAAVGAVSVQRHGGYRDENQPASSMSASAPTMPGKHHHQGHPNTRSELANGKGDRTRTAQGTGRPFDGSRVPLGSVSNRASRPGAQGPDTYRRGHGAGREDTEDQQQAAAEVLLAFGQSRD